MASPGGIARPTRVLIADDHCLFRDGVREIFDAEADFEVVGEASDGREALDMASRLTPDVVLMDLSMASVDGLTATRSLTGSQPDCRVVILTARDDPQDLLAGLAAGASGYLLKTMHADELLGSLRALRDGGTALAPAMVAHLVEEYRRLIAAPAPAPPPPGGVPELTAREHHVLSLVAEGKSDKEIARTLSLSIYTVKAHMRSILAKLPVTGRREAARFARRYSML